MKTICYYINNSEETAKALYKITQTIPCFLEQKLMSDGSIEVEIKCREANVVFVEKTLAKFV